MKHGFFLFFSISKPKVYSPIPCFFRFMFHLTCICKPLCFLKWLLCFDGPYTVFILIYPHWSLLYPLYKVCWLRVVLFSNAALTHTHRFQTLSWTRCNDWKAKICTISPLTGENWSKKAGWNGEKMSCAVTYKGEGMVEAGIGSEKFLRIRIQEILKETPFFGPSS